MLREQERIAYIILPMVGMVHETISSGLFLYWF